MLEPRDLVPLLPRRPATFAVVGRAGNWPETLERWGAVSVTPERAELVVVTGDRAELDAATVLDVRGRRRRASSGRAIERYAIGRSPGGGVELRPGRWARRRLTIDGRPSAAPAALAASGLGPCISVRIGPDPRRRVALLTAGAVVKVPRDPEQHGRGAVEQDTLGELVRLGVGHAPAPLGAGDCDGVAWSAETRAPGVSLESVRDPDRSRRLLDAVAHWLAVIASRTRGDDRPGPAALRGPHVVTAGVVPPTGVPAVVQHGDLASGLNVLVDGDDFTAIDWETARRDGLPLADLLPVLCLGVARARGASTPESESEVVLRLCRGDDPDSPWLFDHIRRYAAAAGLDGAVLGPLATLAWAYQASMRLVHAELVTNAGGRPPAWVSAAEHVAEAWATDPRLGPSWPAVTGAS